MQEKFRPNGAIWMLDNRNTILLAIMVGILIVIMIVPQGLDYRGGGDPTSGSALSRLTWLLLLATGALFTISRGGLAWLLARNLNPFLLIIVALACASMAWSIDPHLTLRRLVRLITFVLVCTAFVLNGWHASRFQNVVRPVLTFFLFGSIVFCLVDPKLAIEKGTSYEVLNAWHGLATQKNALGALACLGLIFWLHAWLAGEVKSKSALVGGVIAAICLVFSRSSTAMGTTIVSMSLLVMLMRTPVFLRSARPFIVSILAVLILIFAIAILNVVPGLSFILDPIVALTGKNMTFTGRTDIWAILADHIKLHPLLGTGYQAYWTPQPIPGHPSYEMVVKLYGFYPTESHNGYIDVMNDLGYIGLICLLAFLFFYIRQSLQLMKVNSNQAALFLVLFFEQAINNLTEAIWFNVQAVDTVLMMLATLALGRTLLEYRLRSVFTNPYSSSNKIKDELSRCTDTHSTMFQKNRNTIT